jgi:hypothetical protein
VKPATGTELPPRTFACRRPEGSRYYSLRISAGGHHIQTVVLTAEEVRSCAETLLGALGWTLMPAHPNPPEPQ